MVQEMPRSQPPSVPVEPGWIASWDGLRLRYDRHGDPGAPATLFAHGFGQTRHAWSQTARAIAARGGHALTADGRGHGESGWAPGGRYVFEDFIADVPALVAAAGPSPAWVGASMGGLLGMVAEAERGPLFRTLVLVDITPRWERAGVERILGFMRARPDGFASLEEAQQAIREYLPHRADPRSPERLRRLLVPTPDGRLRWHWDPALLDSVAHEAERWGARLEAAARALRLPVLLVSGRRSDVVSEETIAEFRRLVPHADHVALDDATHMVAGDANDRFTAVVLDWLAAHGALPAADAPAHRFPIPKNPVSATESA
jgi:pimeloyl-ACP methyl ester carboxylesterase